MGEGEGTMEELASRRGQDAAILCYAELLGVIERWLPLIEPGEERDRFERAATSFRRAAHELPPLPPVR